MEKTMPSPEVNLAVGAGFASLMGIAARLRKGKKITLAEVLRTAFISLMAGLLIGLLTYNYFIDHERMFQFWAICGLAGFGGHSMLEVLYQLLVRIIEAKSAPLNSDTDQD